MKKTNKRPTGWYQCRACGEIQEISSDREIFPTYCDRYQVGTYMQRLHQGHPGTTKLN